MFWQQLLHRELVRNAACEPQTQVSRGFWCSPRLPILSFRKIRNKKRREDDTWQARKAGRSGAVATAEPGGVQQATALWF